MIQVILCSPYGLLIRSMQNLFRSHISSVPTALLFHPWENPIPIRSNKKRRKPVAITRNYRCDTSRLPTELSFAPSNDFTSNVSRFEIYRGTHESGFRRPSTVTPDIWNCFINLFTSLRLLSFREGKYVMCNYIAGWIRMTAKLRIGKKRVRIYNTQRNRCTTG